MTVLVGIALKSLFIAALTLCILQLMSRRSAAERSSIAHVGLLALVIIAVAPVVLPKWTVQTPAMFSRTDPAAASLETPTLMSGAGAPLNIDNAGIGAARGANLPFPTPDAAVVATAVYAIPAASLLIITFLALLRLFALRARAEVLVDGHWLSALARAQRRMGFKHGTALLVSNELASPLSWGLMRPVILLNDRAIKATDEAEAIIAHELAHVARMDWIKLLLARLATALFWFNPLVWILAREAHQLREEAADDSVLSADIIDTDYAQLLVGVARPEWPGLLLGAHGVAPSKSSLARRVARVLDGESVRRPVARSFTVGVFAGAALIAAPLAAITITPAVPTMPKTSWAAISRGETSYHVRASDVPADLPHLIVKGVSASVSTATAAIVPHVTMQIQRPLGLLAASGASAERGNGGTVALAPGGAKVTIYPPDSQGRRRLVAVGASGLTAVSYADADGGADAYGSKSTRKPADSAIKSAIEMKAAGVSPDYAASIRAASPGMRTATLKELIELKWLGITPDYVRELSAGGFANLRASEIEQARAIGLSADYARAIRATGVPVSFRDVIELRAMEVRPEDLARMRASGTINPEKIGVSRSSPRRSRATQPPEFPNSDPDG